MNTTQIQAAGVAICLHIGQHVRHLALRASTAYVELYTGNGTREQPPAWASSFDAEVIAKRARAAIAKAVGAGS